MSFEGLPREELQKELDFYQNLSEQFDEDPANAEKIARSVGTTREEVPRKIAELFVLLRVPSPREKAEVLLGVPVEKIRSQGITTDYPTASGSFFGQLHPRMVDDVREQLEKRHSSLSEVLKREQYVELDGIHTTRLIETRTRGEKPKLRGHTLRSIYLHAKTQPPLGIEMTVFKHIGPSKARTMEDLAENCYVHMTVTDIRINEDVAVYELPATYVLTDQHDEDALRLFEGSQEYAFTPIALAHKLAPAMEETRRMKNPQDEVKYHLGRFYGGDRFIHALMSIPWDRELRKLVESHDLERIIVGTMKNGILVPARTSVSDIGVGFRGASRKNR
jgi:hypothetical protein